MPGLPICNELNANEKANKRMLRVLWKNIKIDLKKTIAVARRESFKTGGRLPLRPETNELGDLMTVIIDSQQPLEGISDDDHLDSSDWGPFQSSFGRTHSFNMCHTPDCREN
ncbi:unnamed protein product [Oncorhynchus mykiss]|uniref:Uncharacterized protein n=1 Tax=Oncorhynchus mykiss TaxID=8022 RepID=A0A060YYZ9_ONCMY|nr:unnamed protein product [Oncorhynchus mykiss]